MVGRRKFSSILLGYSGGSKNSVDMKHEQEKYRSLITWERPRKTEELTKQQESTP